MSFLVNLVVNAQAAGRIETIEPTLVRLSISPAVLLSCMLPTGSVLKRTQASRPASGRPLPERQDLLGQDGHPA